MLLPDLHKSSMAEGKLRIGFIHPDLGIGTSLDLVDRLRANNRRR